MLRQTNPNTPPPDLSNLALALCSNFNNPAAVTISNQQTIFFKLHRWRTNTNLSSSLPFWPLSLLTDDGVECWSVFKSKIYLVNGLVNINMTVLNPHQPASSIVILKKCCPCNWVILSHWLWVEPTSNGINNWKMCVRCSEATRPHSHAVQAVGGVPLNSSRTRFLFCCFLEQATCKSVMDSCVDVGEVPGEYFFHYSALEADEEGNLPSSPAFNGSRTVFQQIVEKKVSYCLIWWKDLDLEKFPELFFILL